MSVLIVGKGNLSNNIRVFLKDAGISVEQVGGRELLARGSEIKSKSLSTIIFSGFLCRKIANDFNSFYYNIQLAREVIELSVRKKTDRVIFFSTVDVFGVRSGPNHGDELRALSFVDPADCYSMAKFAVEKLLQFELLKNGVALDVVRCPGIYGVIGEDSLISNWFHQVSERNEIRVNSDAGLVRTFLYWKDLARFCVKLLPEADRRYSVFLLGGKEALAISSIAALVIKITGGRMTFFNEAVDRARMIRINDNRCFADFGLDYTPLVTGVSSFWREYRLSSVRNAR